MFVGLAPWEFRPGRPAGSHNWHTGPSPFSFLIFTPMSPGDFELKSSVTTALSPGPLNPDSSNV